MIANLSFSRKMSIGTTVIVYDGETEQVFVTPSEAIISDSAEILKFCIDFPRFLATSRKGAKTYGLLPKPKAT